MADGKGGRPRRYTRALADKILLLLSSGTSLRKICAMDGMPASSTVHFWNINNEDGFSRRYALARRECSYSRLDIAHDALADKESMLYIDEGGNRRVDAGSVNQARAYADYVRWEASKLIPEMADKVNHELTGRNGAPVAIRWANAAEAATETGDDG